MSIVKAQYLATSDGTEVVDLDKLSTTGYYTKQIITQVDTTSRTFSTAWALGPTFASIPCSANSLLLLDYFVPCRNDSTSWGGAYIEPQVSFDGGTTWNSLGGSGYDGGVMKLGNSAISHYYQQILINPGLTSAFNARFRFYFRSYDGTLSVNVSHNINAISGTAALDNTNYNGSYDNINQHYLHVVVEELASYT